MAGAAFLRHLGPRLFAASEPAVPGLTARSLMPAAVRIIPARMASTAAEAAKEGAGARDGTDHKPEGGQSKKVIVSYWGIDPPKLVKEDGTEWRWTCFRVSQFSHHTLFHNPLCHGPSMMVF
jgi:ubiquinol oxidase